MEEKKEKPKSRSVAWIFVIAGVLLLLLFLAGLIPRMNRNKKNEALSKEKSTALIAVNGTKIDISRDTTGVELPGDVRSFRETFIYSRVNGYVKKWMTDIGAPVKEGDLLAIIETPELDQSLAQAKANLTLAQANFKRVSSVNMPGAVSEQEIDQYRSSYEANQAVVRQIEANVSFKWVRAPYDGTVTQRNIDEGTLITAGSTQPMFKVEQTSPLRIYINVPQNYAASATPGLKAEVIMKKYPVQSTFGKISRTAGSINTATRTLLTEVLVDNKDRKILPGMYVLVHLDPQSTDMNLLIPANTMITRNSGPQVAIVNSDSTITIRDVRIGRDYGQNLQILSGLQGGELLVQNPSEKLRDHLKVKVLPQQSNDDKKKNNQGRNDGKSDQK